MIFFEYEQVVKLHSSLILKTGGMDGVRDKNLLDSALKAPFQTFGGNELYPGILDKAAQLCYSLIENHPFADGNKRIGVHLALLFLKLNNVGLLYSQQDLIDFGLNVASGKMSKDEIKEWLFKHKLPTD
ncbi:MAG: type II toxin-antitoxin system death-on-curing family toxin [Treponema sp.]|jgi:death-on-curing protein|nr:type II toxin-antitoxin system death-on-curing family toxin [Treponema sp.]MBQ2354778.1 type II toxin-antitoxin system death-on-curing family toxin [Treponema sp.]MBR4245430.1 type II toxin-antitoxin system death-on-curing family toxin [Treponema sp.]